MSDPARWARIRELFERAAELAPEARAAFVERESAGDEDLRERIMDMLDADAAADDFLEDPPSPGRWEGRRFGAYEVVAELGRGGMGVVLLGRRADGRYDRKVALKIVPAALVQRHAETRFRSEVRILGGLDHPNIARLLDAGDTDEGLAYLVMEYVDGDRLDVFADERALDLPARLRLFLSVLEGVDYAHARGVVHRDLKPSNILVTRDGVPKLVDFGIAKLLDPTAAEGLPVMVTRTAQRVLTPEYASPEQVRGTEVDGRSDIYSLGVVLYRLLTGRAPYRVDSTQPRAAERVICESDPSRPSDSLSREGWRSEATVPDLDADVLARQRSSTQDRLRRSLRGDLDTIVLHALAKDPEHRYATAGAFADDIERHLEGRPIRARQPSAAYRVGRAIRRRWLPLTIAAAVTVAVTAFGWQAREARLQRAVAAANSAELTGLVTSVLSTLNTDLAGQDEGPTATRAAAVEAAVASLDSLAARASGPPAPELLRALASAYREVGVLQGHPTSANLGRVDDALASFEQSLELLSSLIELDSGDVVARLSQVETWVLLSDVHRVRGENGTAQELLDGAEAGLDAIAGQNPAGSPELSVRAMVYERQAVQAEGEGDFTTASRYVSDMTDLAVRSAELSPEGAARIGALEEVVLSLQYESYMHSKAAQSEEAIATQRRAAEFADSLAGLPGTTQRIEGIQAGAWHQLGWRYNDADRPAEAEVAFTRALELVREIVRDDRRNQGAIASLGQYLEGRGQARIRGERWQAALEDLSEAIEVLTPLLESLPSATFIVAQAHRERGEAHTRLGNYEVALREHDQGIAMADRLLQIDTAFAPARKILSLARLSRSLHHRLRVDVTGDSQFCGDARRDEVEAYEDWIAMREAGLMAAGEEAIWTDFEAMMPDVCPGEGVPGGEGARRPR